jgi:radical SAM superfamily enzyme YgiQ (UPF0313 family)
MSPRLLLINPAMRANGRQRANAGGIATMEPLGLAYVAALTPPHWEVELVDEVRQEIPADARPDLVALTSLSITVPRAYEIAGQYRAQGIPVVLGGVHATLLPDEAEQYVDVVYQGEAETLWPTVLADFEAGRLKRRYDGGAAGLDGLPWPRREVYRHRYVMQLVSASRGCHYRCEFCTLWKMDGGRYRARPPAEVLDEIEASGSRRPILFTDENVFVDRDWALALFGGMARRGLRRSYAVQASLNMADDAEMLTALKRSGCMTVLIGFESLSEESLRVMRKGVNLKIGVAHYKDKVRRLHDHGLAVSGSFMFGNDGDGPEVFEKTVQFVLESGLDLAHFGLLTPTPGTDLFRRLDREGRLLYTDFPGDYASYDLNTAAFRPLKMTPEQMEEGLVWATRAISSLGVAARRAVGTWRNTHNLLMTALAFGWNRSGLYSRVLG